MKGQGKKQITGKIAQVDGLFCLMVWHPNIAGLKSVLALRGVLHLLAAPDTVSYTHLTLPTIYSV